MNLAEKMNLLLAEKAEAEEIIMEISRRSQCGGGEEIRLPVDIANSIEAFYRKRAENMTAIFKGDAIEKAAPAGFLTNYYKGKKRAMKGGHYADYSGVR